MTQIFIDKEVQQASKTWNVRLTKEAHERLGEYFAEIIGKPPEKALTDAGWKHRTRTVSRRNLYVLNHLAFLIGLQELSIYPDPTKTLERLQEAAIVESFRVNEPGDSEVFYVVRNGDAYVGRAHSIEEARIIATTEFLKEEAVNMLLTADPQTTIGELRDREVTPNIVVRA